MKRRCVISGPGGELAVGSDERLAVISGPCVLEGVDEAVAIGKHVKAICERLGLGYVFKASFDKANRSSIRSARGPGMPAGLDQLAEVRERLGVPVTTDLHEPDQASDVARVVDVLQIPAFLCRQTDLLLAAGSAAAEHTRAVNIKKGQFLSPEEMAGPVRKVLSTGCRQVMVTERGTFFGYHRLVNDFAGLGDLLEIDPDSIGGDAQSPASLTPAVCFDATHSVQLPGAGEASGGRRERVPLLARAAAAAGVDALFVECHPQPERAPSDGSNMLRLDDVEGVLAVVAGVWEVVRGRGGVGAT
jgi:2-dehydro-3-deoxyphosphooctonate aldolase (KDO 8-P synthase)